MERFTNMETGAGTALRRAAVRDPFDCVRDAHFAQDDRKAAARVCHSRASSLLAREESRVFAQG
jgi:hypothetical protein